MHLVKAWPAQGRGGGLTAGRGKGSSRTLPSSVCGRAGLGRTPATAAWRIAARGPPDWSSGVTLPAARGCKRAAAASRGRRSLLRDRSSHRLRAAGGDGGLPGGGGGGGAEGAGTAGGEQEARARTERGGGAERAMAGDSQQTPQTHQQPYDGEPFLIGVSGGTASGKVPWAALSPSLPGRRGACGRRPRAVSAAAATAWPVRLAAGRAPARGLQRGLGARRARRRPLGPSRVRVPATQRRSPPPTHTHPRGNSWPGSCGGGAEEADAHCFTSQFPAGHRARSRVPNELPTPPTSGLAWLCAQRRSRVPRAERAGPDRRPGERTGARPGQTEPCRGGGRRAFRVTSREPQKCGDISELRMAGASRFVVTGNVGGFREKVALPPRSRTSGANTPAPWERGPPVGVGLPGSLLSSCYPRGGDTRDMLSWSTPGHFCRWTRGRPPSRVSLL